MDIKYINEFVDKLYYGDEMFIKYKGIRYFIQGWTKEGKSYLNMVDYDDDKGKYIFEYVASSMKECADIFLNSKLWEGKTFLEIVNDVEWADW